MAVTGFNQLLQSMGQADFFTGILPFVLSYVLFFLALKKIPIFSDEEERMSALVAIAMAFFVARFIAVNPLYQNFFVEYFGRLVIGLSGFLGLFMLLGFIGFDFDDERGFGIPLIIMLAVLAAIGAFGLSNGLFALIPRQAMIFGVSLADIAEFSLNSGLLYLVVIGGAIYWATVNHDEDDPDTGDILNKLLGTD